MLATRGHSITRHCQSPMAEHRSDFLHFHYCHGRCHSNIDQTRLPVSNINKHRNARQTQSTTANEKQVYHGAVNFFPSLRPWLGVSLEDLRNCFVIHDTLLVGHFILTQKQHAWGIYPIVDGGPRSSKHSFHDVAQCNAPHCALFGYCACPSHPGKAAQEASCPSPPFGR